MTSGSHLFHVEHSQSSLSLRFQPLRAAFREHSLYPPPVENPFLKERNYSHWHWFCIGLGSVLLLPLRIFLLLLIVIIAWPLTVAVTAFYPKKQSQPLPKWRRRLTKILVLVLCRSLFFILGFLVKVKGERASSLEAPILVAAPHSSFFDGIAWVFTGLPSIVSRQETARVPLVGRIVLIGQPVLVSRSDPDSRKNTVNEIKKRATSSGIWPQILIFPEATCTNRSCLITFKLGAFLPGVPVQPVLLQYPNKVDTVTWTWQGYSAPTLVLLTLTQLFTKMELEFMPVYIPDNEEKKDPSLYARRVRNVMANALHLPVTDHTFEDCRLMISAGKLTLPMEAGLVEFTKITQKLKLDWDTIKNHLIEYTLIAAKSKGGSIGIEEFANYLTLPISDSLKQLFELFDRNHDGTIDFREYVIGLSVLCNPANTEELLRLAFRLFDIDEDGYVTEEEFARILEASFGVRDLDVSAIFQEIAKEDSKHISYFEFKSFALNHPQYARLFSTYLELQASHKNRKDDSQNCLKEKSLYKVQQRIISCREVCAKFELHQFNKNKTATSERTAKNRNFTRRGYSKCPLHTAFLVIGEGDSNTRVPQSGRNDSRG
ncbi:lysophosphatidylcholine acyltransferase 2-like [Gracilinanus agilis]|uniref:lysophosphatidylcholine acyltransferase 2-like n=1 Tax=Gracilinanus agilis TaxID=191870 RepID=UPI001CFE0F49|nr:lysophosphatidylcholine acyltransferase 2-like [Gracilinanus agilis]